MFTVQVKKPESLVKGGRFKTASSTKCNSHLHHQSKRQIDEYLFKRDCYKIEASLKALEGIPCSGTVSISFSEGTAVFEGSFDAWFEHAALIIEQARDDIEDIVQSIRKKYPENSATVSFELKTVATVA